MRIGYRRFIDLRTAVCENPPKRLILRGYRRKCLRSVPVLRIPPSQKNGSFSRSGRQGGVGLTLPLLAGAIILSIIAGWTDWRSRRIPNWLTVPGWAVGLVLSIVLGGWAGLKNSLLGTVLAFGLLLPFWLLKSLGAGDLKFAVALGAYTGPGRLIDILIGSVFVAGIMALILVIYKRRLLQTIKNIGHILISLITFRLPGSHVTLDNPDALSIPKGVALALTVVAYGILLKLRMVA